MNSWEEISKEEAEEEEWGEDNGKDDAGLFEGLGSGLDEMRSFEEADDEEEDDGYESLNPFDFNAKIQAKPDDHNNNDSDDDNLDIKDLVGCLGIQEEMKASSLFDERPAREVFGALQRASTSPTIGKGTAVRWPTERVPSC